MAEAADADDANARGGGDVVDDERREDGDAAAEQRAGLGDVEAFGQRAHPCPLRANAVGKAAVAADDGALRVRAEMVIAGEAFAAREAAMRGPAEADRLADLQALGLGPSATTVPRPRGRGRRGTWTCPTRYRAWRDRSGRCRSS